MKEKYKKMKTIKNFKRIISFIFCFLIFIVSQSQAQNMLQDYFTLVAKQNPTLKAKYKQFEAALQQIDQVNSLEDPMLSFGYFISPVETRVGPQRARISLTQKFPWFGTLKAKGDVAALQAEAAYQAFLDARNQLYYQLAEAFYPLYELQRLIAIEQENVDLMQSYKQIATSKFENAKGSMVDVLRVDLILKDAETELDILQEKKESLLTAFNSLLNRDPLQEVELPDTLLLTDFDESDLMDSVWANHPQLQELDLQQKAMQANEKVAKLKNMPNLGFGLDYVMVDQRSGAEIPGNGQDILMPMVTLSIPIFSKKYKAEQKEAQLMQEVYAEKEQATRNTLTANYQQTVYGLYKTRKYIELYQEQLTETQQVLNLLFSAYANDGKEFEELLRMQQQLLKYRRLFVETKIQFKIQKAKLDYILGNTETE